VLTTYTLTIGAIPVLLIALPAVLGQNWARVDASGWVTLVWATIVPVYCAWALWSWVNARAGVAHASLFMFLVPIISGVTGWLLLEEHLGIQNLAGAGLVFCALLLARRQTAAAVPTCEPVQSTARS
jgi:drug/metabolite transporter (DMT)-like permease